jgi:photosystem II stability/assembly factor-like uncharacterized protein
LGIILKSTDGGYSWTQISHGAADRFEDIVMKPSGTGIAVGNLGTIVRTTDFGQHWIAMQVVDESGIYNRMNAVEAVDEDSWIAVGEFGVVFRSDDDGATWQLIARQPVDDIFDISFLDSNEGWSFGYRSTPYGFISHTTDGGQTWTFLREKDVIPFAPTIGQVMPSGRGWGLYPQTIYATTDDGFDQTLTYHFDDLSSGDSWQSMEFADDNVGWFGGFFGGLRRTTDGGDTLEPQTLPGFVWQDGDRMLDIRALSDQEVYAATFRSGANFVGTIYRTTNGGTQWTALPPMFDLTNQGAGALNQIDVLPNGGIWATGGVGFIWSSGIVPQTVPGSFLVSRGTHVAGGVGELAASDDADLLIRRATADIQSRTEFQVKSVSPVASPSSLTVTLEGAVFARSQVNQTIELFDYVADDWEQVDTRAASRFGDSTAQVVAIGDLSRFVQPDTMCIEARIRYESVVPRQQFSSNTDQFIWTIGQ